MSALVDTSNLSNDMDCSPAQLRTDILLQLKTFGPQTLNMFFKELWEADCEEQIQQVLNDMVKIGEIIVRQCPCGTWYYPKDFHPVC